jgi:hypothetical protein
MRSVTLQKASCLYIFLNELYPTTLVQQRQNVDAVRCRTFFSWLINIFVFDILQVPGECIQICSGCIALTCKPCLCAYLSAFHFRRFQRQEQYLVVN